MASVPAKPVLAPRNLKIEKVQAPPYQRSRRLKTKEYIYIYINMYIYIYRTAEKLEQGMQEHKLRVQARKELQDSCHIWPAFVELWPECIA